MKKIFSILFVAALIALPMIALAGNGFGEGGGNGYGHGGGAAAAPIDGGLSLLIAAGIGAGIKKIASKKNEEKEK